MTAPFGRRPATVTEVRDSGAYRLVTVADTGGPRPRPGQFYMLATVSRWAFDGERPYLPRAFSYAACTAAEAGFELGFLVDPVGPGTGRLAECEVGEELWLVGPLGVPFSAPPDLDSGVERVLLAGGGIGTAPLAVLDHDLAEGAAAVCPLLGFRGSAHAGGIDLFRSETSLASEDGSLGARGLVTDLLSAGLDAGEGAVVYACGPPTMLEAIRVLCTERGVGCELAMESGMACGFGACFGCVVPTRSGYRRLCVDGPVVDAAEIETALVAGSGHR